MAVLNFEPHCYFRPLSVTLSDRKATVAKPENARVMLIVALKND